MRCTLSFKKNELNDLEVGACHGLVNYKDTKTKCRL
jgi:hypothetical protein